MDSEDRYNTQKELTILCTAVYKEEYDDGGSRFAYHEMYRDYEDYLQQTIEGNRQLVCYAQIEPSPDGQLRHPDDIRDAQA